MKCECCGKEDCALVPHPQDDREQVLVCEACDYEIQERLTAVICQPEKLDYGSVTHGY